jgi:hypothetical protein
MTEQEFVKNYDLVNNWVNTMRPHWRHLNGDVFNDKDFWAQCIHSVGPDVWTAWCELYGELRQSQMDVFRRHTYVYEDTVVIATRLDKGEPMTKPYNKTGYNKPIFRGAMAIKDIIAEISDNPFTTTQNVVKTTKRVKPTKEEVLAQWAKTDAMLRDLFDTNE